MLIRQKEKEVGQTPKFAQKVFRVAVEMESEIKERGKKEEALESLEGKIKKLHFDVFIEIKFLGKETEVRLVRRLPRWDLRSQTLYSTASVYDITALARDNRHQLLYFKMSDELRSEFW